jgi:hypothetical protein
MKLSDLDELTAIQIEDAVGKYYKDTGVDSYFKITGAAFCSEYTDPIVYFVTGPGADNFEDLEIDGQHYKIIIKKLFDRAKDSIIFGEFIEISEDEYKLQIIK